MRAPAAATSDATSGGAPTGGQGGGDARGLARVLSGEFAIAYRHAGRGASVILLEDHAASDGPDSWLFATLSRNFRVMVPAFERRDHSCMDQDGRAGVAFSAGLRGFLDGLGLTRVRLVATGPYAVPALMFSLLDPERVERVALVFRDHADPDLTLHATADDFRVAETSVFVGRIEQDDGTCAATAELLRFLAASHLRAPGESGA